VARFDYHGVGESSGEVRTFRLDQPFTEDVAAVLRWLTAEHGLERFVLMGTCFGARTAMAAAPEIARLEAVALFPPPVRDLALGEQFGSYPLSWYLRKLFRARTFKRLLNARFRRAYRRLVKKKVRAVGHGLRAPADEAPSRAPDVSPIFLRQLKSLLGRGLPIYVLYGDADADYEDFLRALSGELGPVIRDAGRQLRVDVIKGHVHGMTNIENQDRVIDLLVGWIASDFGAGDIAQL
jgi:pimeloyl-ACP methyl ester carboxylesterase